MTQFVHRRDALKLGAAGLAVGLSAAALAEGPKPKPMRLAVIGTGGRGTHLLQLFLDAGVEVPALCDIQQAHLDRAIDVADKARGRKPEGYSRSPKDYQRMLARDDLDAVVVATPMQVHAPMSIDALRAGKAVFSEVAACMTLDECWGLVRAAEETKRPYMLAENCCYGRDAMTVATMVRRGVFGDLTFAECGYVHDCRGLMFDGQGKLTWRGEMVRDFRGNLYPTHSLGPVAKWLGIHRGDRMVSLVAMDTKQAGMDHFVAARFPADHPARKVPFRSGDSVSVLIRTAKGAMIDLRYDLSSARPVPSTTYYSLQGAKASYDSRIASVWIDGRSKGHQWEPFGAYAKEFDDPLWTQSGAQAEGAGHGGMDYFVVRAFLDALARGGPPPVDVYDAAAWSSIIPLSGKSIAEGGKPQEIPDFTGGKWQTGTS